MAILSEYWSQRHFQIGMDSANQITVLTFLTLKNYDILYYKLYFGQYWLTHLIDLGSSNICRSVRGERTPCLRGTIYQMFGRFNGRVWDGKSYLIFVVHKVCILYVFPLISLSVSSNILTFIFYKFNLCHATLIWNESKCHHG